MRMGKQRLSKMLLLLLSTADCRKHAQYRINVVSICLSWQADLPTMHLTEWQHKYCSVGVAQASAPQLCLAFQLVPEIFNTLVWV